MRLVQKVVAYIVRDGRVVVFASRRPERGRVPGGCDAARSARGDRARVRHFFHLAVDGDVPERWYGSRSVTARGRSTASSCTGCRCVKSTSSPPVRPHSRRVSSRTGASLLDGAMIGGDGCSGVGRRLPAAGRLARFAPSLPRARGRPTPRHDRPWPGDKDSSDARSPLDPGPHRLDRQPCLRVRRLGGSRSRLPSRAGRNSAQMYQALTHTGYLRLTRHL